MRRRVIKLAQMALVLVMAVALVLGGARTTLAYSYATNLLTTTTLNDWGKNLSYQQTIYLSAADVIRTNKGDLSYVANAHLGANGSRTVTTSLVVQCRSSAGTVLQEYSAGDKRYWVAHANYDYNSGSRTLPAGTTEIRYSASVSIGTSGTLELESMSLQLFDNEKPAYSTASLAAINGHAIPPSGSVAGTYPAGTKLRYAVKFNEPVVVTNSGTFNVSLGGTLSAASYAEQSADRMTLSYDYTIPTSGAVSDYAYVRMSSIQGLVVRDDAGNSLTTDRTLSDAYGIYMDNKRPAVSSFTTTASANSCYTAGDRITFNVYFHEAITVSGSPSISLQNGKVAVYTPGSGSQTDLATFVYTVGSADNNTDALAISGVDFSGIVDKVNQAASYAASDYNNFLTNYRLKIDTLAPTVSLSDPGSGWLGQDHAVLLTPTDASGSLVGSGVDELYAIWTADSGSTTPTFPSNPNVGSAHTVSAPAGSGTHYLWVKAVDLAGNARAIKAPYAYKFDLTAPTVAIAPQLIAGYPGLASVSVTVDDAHSGVASQTYSWLDAETVTVSSGDLGDEINYPSVSGEYTLVVTATDSLGNQVTKQAPGLRIDRTPPTVAFTPAGGDQFKRAHSVGVELTDADSGVTGYAYQWTTSPERPAAGWNPTALAAFTTPQASGAYYLHLRCYDGAGNTGYAVSGAFNLDNTAPTITVLPNGNAGAIGSHEYEIGVTVQDAVTLTADLTVEYAFSTAESADSLEWQSLTSSTVTLSDFSATTYLYLRATDELGNTALFKSAPFVADTTAPTGGLANCSGDYLRAAPVLLEFSASDDYTIAADLKMQISVDGVQGEWVDFATEKSVSFQPTEGAHTISVQYRDASGNTSPPYSVNFTVDLTPPTIDISYSPASATNGAVTATASTTLPDELTSPSSHVFTENGSYTFTARDSAGNTAERVAQVTWIDTTAPTASFSSADFDNKSHQTVEVTITAQDNANGIASLEYRFLVEGEDEGEWMACNSGATVSLSGVDGKYYLQARAVDGVGNQGTQQSDGLYLDNTAPVGSIQYQPATRTALDVSAVLSLNEAATITNNDGASTYVFRENGTFCFQFVDEAGNVGSQTASVDWIDCAIPAADVSLRSASGESVDPDSWVNHDLLVTILPSAHATVVNASWNGRLLAESAEVVLYDEATDTYLITAYGVFGFTVRDVDTALERRVELTAKIDKTAPVLQTERRIPEGWTNKDVTVTITAEDAFSTVTYLNGNTHTFSLNGSHTFYFTDALGNTAEHTVTVTTIDKIVPAASISYTVNGEVYDGTGTNQDVVATISLESVSPATVTNNGGSFTHVFTDNGEFVFEFADEAGNRGSCTAKAERIDKAPPTVTFQSDAFDGKKHQSISITVNAVDHANGVAALEYRFVRSGSSGGDWSDCANGAQVGLLGVDGSYRLEVRARDGLGNQGTSQSELVYLDNIAPIASVQYDPSTRTARNVTATVSFNEPATVQNNGGSTAHVFTDNGSFTFEYVDEAGNRGTQLATVTWIDRDVPEATLGLTDTLGQSVSQNSWVNFDLLARIAPPAGCELSNLSWNGSPVDQAAGISLIDEATGTYLVTEYGLFTFTVRDTVTGVESDGSFTLRIDKTAPLLRSERRNPDGWTNGDVIVTIVAEDALSPVTYLNGDSHIFSQNGSHTFSFTDAAGNQGEYTATVTSIDRELPVASVVYTVGGTPYAGGPTNQNVVATISFDSLSPVTVLNNGGSRSHPFTANGEFTFQFASAAGSGSCTARVTEIDKTPPTVDFSSLQLDGKSHQAVSVTVTALDQENGVASLQYRFALFDGLEGDWLAMSNDQTVSLDGVDGRYRLQVRATDDAGNQAVSQSEYLYLDNTAPLGSVDYQPGTRTAQNVQASLHLNESATVTNNGGSSAYVFTENGSFTFEFVDEAGNRGNKLAEVSWIDRSIPSAVVSLRDGQSRPIAAEAWVNHDLWVTFTPRANAVLADLTWNGLPVASADGVSLHDAASNTYLVSGYGVFGYTVRDSDTGVEGRGTLPVRIDKAAPVVKSERRTPEGWTNGNVTVTIQAEDALTTVTYLNGSSHLFTENGSFTFCFVDDVGNQGEHTVAVTNIDKAAPVPSITYTVGGTVHDGRFTNQDVTAQVTFDSISPVTVTNNGGGRSYTFASNGSFTFQYVDAAGNSGSCTAEVSCIDKTAPTAYVTYSTERWTNQDVLATLQVSDSQSGAENHQETYNFQENGTHAFIAYDQAGNAKTVIASVTRIDKTPPTLSYTLSPANRTPYSVFATVAADESVTWLNNGGRPSLQFTSNGSFTFRAQDRAGNIAEQTVVVENISKESTPVVLTYSGTEPTNGNVYVTIAPQDAQNDTIFVLNNGGSATHVFTENGEFVYNYRNPAGVSGAITASVSTIDKLAPEVEVSYSTTELTNGSVIATMIASEPVVWPFGVKDGALVFRESNRLLIPVADKVGNVTQTLLEVTWIDVTPPTISLTEEYQAIPLGTRFDAMSGVTVQDEHALLNGLTYQGEVNTSAAGDYTIVYTATDAAGNTATRNKQVTVYDPRQFNVIINGRMPVNSEVEISGGEMRLTTINQEGKLKLLCLPGKKGSGDFKLKGSPITNEHTFTAGGYYTLYVQDEERHTQLVYLFVKL